MNYIKILVKKIVSNLRDAGDALVEIQKRGLGPKN
jgi:hypothetical protein